MDMKDKADKANLKQATLWSILGILATLIVGIPAIYLTVKKP